VQDLEELIEKYKDKPNENIMLEHFDMTGALTLLHETYHFAVVDLRDPATTDYESTAEDCWFLARDVGTIKTYANAESYALDAFVIYLQQTFKSSNIALPLVARGLNAAQNVVSRS
jgi:hypothetical protein